MAFTATDLIKYISSATRINENTALISCGDLPSEIRWIDFIANLTALQTKGALRFSVSAVIDSLVAHIELIEHEKTTDVALINQWSPTRQTYTKLSSFGINKVNAQEALKLYTSSVLDHNDRDFIKFAMDLSTKCMDLLLIPPNWTPSKLKQEQIMTIGLEPAAYTEYLEKFRTGNYAHNASWDDDFERYCKTRWSSDNRNPNANESTLMTNTWRPTVKTIKDLINYENFQSEEIELQLGVYRIYWLERGEARANWDGHFKWWAKSQARANAS